MTLSCWLGLAARRAVPAGHMGIAVVLGAAVLLGTLICGSVFVLKNARQTALHAAEIRLQNSALVVTNAINRQLLQVDGALVSLPSLFEAAASDQNAEIDPNLAGRLLRAFNFETFLIRDLLLIRSDGTVWAAARPRPRNLPLPLTPSDASATSHPGAIAIEGPIYNTSTGNWSWYLIRPINLRGVGRLQTVAEVPLPSIMALLEPAGAVPGLRIYIERPDGLRLASLPHDELKVGKQQVAAISSLGSNGIAFNLPSWLTPSPTIAVWRNTLYPDVQVALVLDLSASLVDWTRDRDRLLAALGVACLLVIGLATALYAALRQHERAEAERRKSRDLLDGAIEAMSDGFVMWDEQDRLITCNHQFRDLYAISADIIRPGAQFEDIIREGAKRGQYPQAGDDIDEFVRETIEWHHGNEGILERLLPDGRWVQITERLNPTGGIVGIRTDITLLKQTMADLASANWRVKQAIEKAHLQNVTLTERDQELRTRNILFTAALNNMSQGLLMVDSDRRIIVCNERFHDIFHISKSSTSPGTTTVALFRTIDGAGLDTRAAQSIQQQQEEFAASQRSGAFVNVEDEKLALAISQRPLPDGGWIATYEDVTERQRSEGRVHFMAHYDSLTALPNRNLFRTTVTEAIGQLSNSENQLALLYIDLDRFKLVNDTLGHSAGDSLLEIVARRLQGCVRDADMVARLGGDEFAILLITRDLLPKAATVQAQRVIEALGKPYQLGQRQIDLGVSIGIAIATAAAADGEKLLRNADMALYQVKARGGGTYCIFEPEMEARLHARFTIEEELRVALEREQFEVYYQPLVDLRSGRLCGYEALVRWNHPTRGLVMPGQFTPSAEELGIIKPIGAWVLRQACADAARYFGTAKVAVNLSPIQLEDDEIVGTVSAALSASGLDPAMLEIEITESALLNKGARTIAILRRLHDLGLSIALDDFGTGYSSLSYLRSFPFDSLKIDRLFISEMATREDCTAIVSAIVILAEKLSMTTTAEGVETDEQLRLVRDLGCTNVQGYLMGRPQPIHKIIENADRVAAGLPQQSLVRSDVLL